jgi:biopolymer transport protein ExbD
MKRMIIIKKITKHRHSITRPGESRAIDSASIGDMAFLLLIFFIVTSSFILRQGIFFSLPSLHSQAIQIQDNQLIEVYPENDGYTYKGQKLYRTRLIKILRQQKASYPESVMRIRMKENIRYERLVDALSVAKESGLTRVSLKESKGVQAQ